MRARGHRWGSIPGMSDYDSWAPLYDAWASDMTEDVAYYVDLAREADGPIVELMVGSGRVAIEVVRATGKPVLGIDSSPAMVEIARERSAGLPLEVRLGDVRNLALGRRRCARGGRFAFNAFAFSHTIAAQLDCQTMERDGIVTTLRYAPADNRVDIERDDGALLRLWWATKSEWEGLIDVTGLEIEALYGWFDKRPLEDDSPELVFVTRKPPGSRTRTGHRPGVGGFADDASSH